MSVTHSRHPICTKPFCPPNHPRRPARTPAPAAASRRRGRHVVSGPAARPALPAFPAAASRGGEASVREPAEPVEREYVSTVQCPQPEHNLAILPSRLPFIHYSRNIPTLTPSLSLQNRSPNNFSLRNSCRRILDLTNPFQFSHRNGNLLSLSAHRIYPTLLDLLILFGSGASLQHSQLFPHNLLSPFRFTCFAITVALTSKDIYSFTFSSWRVSITLSPNALR